MTDIADSDEWAELAEVVGVIDAEVAAVRAALAGTRDVALAARVQDALLACMAIRDLPPQRPTSLRRVGVPGLNRCLDPSCDAPACLGNRLEGHTLILVHTKTARSRGVMRLTIDEASATAALLAEHLAWGRAALVGVATCDSLFVGADGAAISESAFNTRLAACLQRWGLGAHITFTKVRAGRRRAAAQPPPPLTRAPTQLRHIVATAVSEWTPEQRQGAHGRQAATA